MNIHDHRSSLVTWFLLQCQHDFADRIHYRTGNLHGAIRSHVGWHYVYMSVLAFTSLGHYPLFHRVYCDNREESAWTAVAQPKKLTSRIAALQDFYRSDDDLRLMIFVGEYHSDTVSAPELMEDILAAYAAATYHMPDFS